MCIISLTNVLLFSSYCLINIYSYGRNNCCRGGRYSWGGRRGVASEGIILRVHGSRDMFYLVIMIFLYLKNIYTTKCHRCFFSSYVLYVSWLF